MLHMCRKVLSAFYGGILYDALTPHARGVKQQQQQQQQPPQQQQHMQLLQQQTFAVVATHLKVCRNVGCLVGVREGLRAEYLAQTISRAASGRLSTLPPGATAARRQAAVAPWLVLLGQYLRQAGASLGKAYQTAVRQAAAAHQSSMQGGLAGHLIAASEVLHAAVVDALDSTTELTWLLTVVTELKALWQAASGHAGNLADDSSSNGSSSDNSGVCGNGNGSSGSSSSSSSREQETAGATSAASAATAASAAAAAAAVGAGGVLSPQYGSLDACFGFAQGILPAVHIVQSTARAAKLATEDQVWQGVGSEQDPVWAFVRDTGTLDLAVSLQFLGANLCAQLPVPWCCNNPDCTNMAGASELQLVGGKGCVCGGCKLARYCGPSCQAAHWSQHKAVCDHTVVAAAAASEAAAAPVMTAQAAPASSATV